MNYVESLAPTLSPKAETVAQISVATMRALTDNITVISELISPLQTATEVNVVVNMDPFKPYDSLSKADDSNITMGLFSYEQLYVTQVLIIPAVILLLSSAALLAYAILKHLSCQPILKLYLSALFYSASLVLLVAYICWELLYGLITGYQLPNCILSTTFQIIAITLPGLAVFFITLIRVVFLTFPFNWRDKLCYRNQGIGMVGLSVFAVLLALLPTLQLCPVAVNTEGHMCVFVREWSGKCFTCFFLLIGIGIILPQLLVIVMYGLIYRVVHRSRERSRTLASSTSRQVLKVPTKSTELSKSADSTITLVKEDSKDSAERGRFPWSIIVVLGLNIMSTTPWIVILLAPELFYESHRGERMLTVDIMYSLMLVCLAISPLAYLASTKSVRQKVFKCWN